MKASKTENRFWTTKNIPDFNWISVRVIRMEDCSKMQSSHLDKKDLIHFNRMRRLKDKRLVHNKTATII